METGNAWGQLGNLLRAGGSRPGAWMQDVGNAVRHGPRACQEQEMSNMGAKNSNHLSIPIIGSIDLIFSSGAIPRATLQPECQCVHLTGTEP